MRILKEWLTNDDFVVFHRVAIAENQLGKLAKTTPLHRRFALANEIPSIKAD
jgi:hypothetical protein